MELCSALCGSLDGGEFDGEQIHVCMAEPLPCSPVTITTLLIGYTPVQNKKLKKKVIQKPQINFLGINTITNAFNHQAKFHKYFKYTTKKKNLGGEKKRKKNLRLSHSIIKNMTVMKSTTLT